MVVATGLTRLARGDDEVLRLVRGRRVGLLAHPASVDARLRHAEDIVRELTAAGLTARVADETLPDQYVVIATKAAPATQPKATAMDSAAKAEAWSRVLASIRKPS